MKSLAIMGMMFLSIGAFAQQAPNSQVLKKEKVCIVERDQVQKSDKMKVAPRTLIDAKKISVRSVAVNTKKRSEAKKAHVKDQRMIVPLTRKSVKVDSKM